MRKIKIGRNPDNQIIIKSKKVSREHAEFIKNDDNKYIIKDLGTPHGTFVNGSRTKQAKIDEKSTVQLADFIIDTNILLSKINSSDYKKKETYAQLEEKKIIRIKFEKLKIVYDQYKKDKKKIQRGGGLKKTGVRAALALIPILGNAIGIMMGEVLDVNKDLEELNENFKKDYVCPNCYKFFGIEPYENIEKRGYCYYCKTKFK